MKETTRQVLVGMKPAETRSQAVGDPIGERYSQNQVYHMTGLKNTPNSSIRKLYWIKERWPEIYKNM